MGPYLIDAMYTPNGCGDEAASGTSPLIARDLLDRVELPAYGT